MLKKTNSKNLFALLPFFKPYKRDICFALLALFITATTVLFFGKVIKYLIDFGFSQNSHYFFNIILLTFVVVAIIMAVAGFYRSSLVNTVAEKVVSDLRKKVYNHIIQVSAEFFEITKTGDVISRLTVDTTVLYNVISSTSSFFLRNSLFFIGGIFLMFLTSLKLSLMSMMLIPIAVAPVIFMGKSVKNLSKQSQESLASIGAHIEESINGIKTIQSYLCEEKESKNFSNFVDNSLAISLKKIRIKSLMVASVIAASFGGIALVLWVGGNDVLSKKITSGDLSSFIFYSVLTATSLVSLSQIAGQLQSASAAAARIFELLEINSPVCEAIVTKSFGDPKEVVINCNNINFAYPSRKDFLVLENFNLEIKPSEKIAIVGSSGSGKSTVLQLLMRFYDVNSGSILLNGIDIRDLSFADLRKNFSYISQDCFIFSGTVFENIAYANQSITKEQVAEIISKNSALNFINNLPQKMDSFVGEKGIKLSGGERQRIAIARAIIKDSPILLLDEATSALDNENSKNIVNAISNLAEKKTVITIAHKLSSVIESDKILFVRDGKIVESGSHQELMAFDGFYKKMYEVESLQ